MTNPFQFTQRWWQTVQSKVGVLEVDPTEALDDADTPFLSVALQDKLEHAVEHLLPPSAQVEDVMNVLKKAIQRWQDYDVMPNMLVVLAEPVQSLDGVITGVLQTLKDDPDSQNIHTYRLDEWVERPADYRNIDNMVRDAIASIFKEIRKSDRPHDDSQIETEESTSYHSIHDGVNNSPNPSEPNLAEEESEEEPIHVIVIPALDRYFLRCIDGLEAIETIRQIIVDHPDYFWLIGCNSWAWSYLDKVCYLSAYLDSCWRLSPLKAPDLKPWMRPLEEVAELPPFEDEETRSQSEESAVPKVIDAQVNADTNGTQSPDKKQSDDKPKQDWVSNDEQKHFSDIEKASNGLAAVAAALWQCSLRYEVIEPETDPPVPGESEPELGTMQRGKIKVPDLPALTVDDRYLLYAVLLHGSLSSQHLALSLADPQGMVRAQLQSLSRQDLLLRKNRGWVINPAYYPTLSRELKRNNFLVD